MMAFTLRLFTPLPDRQPLPVELTIDPSRTDLAWSTKLPGGFAAARFGVGPEPGRGPAYGYLPEPIIAWPNAHVEIWHGQALCWEGRLVETEDVGGVPFGGVAEGYGITAVYDDWYESSSATTTTSGEILEAVLAWAAPLLRAGNSEQFIDPQVTHAYNEFTLMYPGDVIDQLIREGNSSGQQIDFAVWENRIAWLKPRTAPSTPDYLVSIDRTIRRRRNYRNMASEAAVNYELAGVDTTTSRGTTSTFIGEWGFRRAVLVSGGELTATGAASLRQVELAKRNQPEDSIEIVREGGRGLERPGGSEVAPYLVRADHVWVQLGHDTTGQREVVVPIIGTEFNASGQSLSVECGVPMLRLVQVIDELRRTSGAVRRNVHPVTGGRTR